MPAPMRLPCPVECGRTRNPSHLMCGACWRRVPKDLQSEVWRTWRKWQRDMASNDARNEYLAARSAAIDAITRKVS